MNKDVLIHVRGLQMMETDDAQEPIEIVVPGQYYFRNGSHYLRYEEMLDDTAETTVNYIKMSPNGVEVRKQGQVNVHMVFEEGKKNKTFYNTPYGTLQMGISATGLELKESEDGIHGSCCSSLLPDLIRRCIFCNSISEFTCSCSYRSTSCISTVRCVQWTSGSEA